MIVAQYDINASMSSIVGGTGNEIKYFLSRPVQKLWNAGKVGVYAPSIPVPRELPLPFEKINGTRFEVYASGYASAVLGSVTYLIQAKDSNSEKITLVNLQNIPSTVDLPFHIK